MYLKFSIKKLKSILSMWFGEGTAWFGEGVHIVSNSEAHTYALELRISSQGSWGPTPTSLPPAHLVPCHHPTARGAEMAGGEVELDTYAYDLIAGALPSPPSRVTPFKGSPKDWMVGRVRFAPERVKFTAWSQRFAEPGRRAEWALGHSGRTQVFTCLTGFKVTLLSSPECISLWKSSEQYFIERGLITDTEHSTTDVSL